MKRLENMDVAEQKKAHGDIYEYLLSELKNMGLHGIATLNIEMTDTLSFSSI